MKKKLRLAILLDTDRLMTYQKEIVDTLSALDYCNISYVIYKKFSNVDKKMNFSYLLYDTYKKIDKLLFGRGITNLRWISIKDTLSDIKKIYLPIDTQGVYDIVHDNIDDEAYNEIDVVLDLSKKMTLGALLSKPKYGVWRLLNTYEPAGFWEVIESHPYTEVILTKVSEGLNGGFVLDRYRTITDLKSSIRNLDTISWRSHMLIEKNLNKLYKEQDTFFISKQSHILFADQPSNSSLTHIDVKLHFQGDERKVVPTNYKMIGVFFKIFMKFSKIFFRKHFTKLQWFLMYVKNDEDINLSLLQYKKLLPHKDDLFWADPFIIDEEEKSYIFYEEFSPTIKGSLWVMIYDHKKEEFSSPREVMNQEYHLSYPFIFKYDENYYMIPETAKHKTVDLYIAEEFPHQWRKVKTFFKDIVAVDTTIHYYNSKWWMFTNIAPKKGFSNNDELHIFYCDNFLQDKWIPHMCNPVITDTTVARNAGMIIEKEGVLYRPSQYCGGYYGRFLNMNKIEVLNEYEYNETTIGCTSAGFDKDLEGIHTINASNKLTVIDVGSRWFSIK